MDSLATELLQELKASSKRWFIAFCVMIALEIFTIIGFVWYISLPVEESTVTQTVDEVDDSDIDLVGGDSYGESGSNSN